MYFLTFQIWAIVLISLSTTGILYASDVVTLNLPEPIQRLKERSPNQLLAAMIVELVLATFWVFSSICLLIGLFLDSVSKVGCGVNGYFWYTFCWGVWNFSYIMLQIFTKDGLGVLSIIMSFVWLLIPIGILSYMIIVLHSYYDSLLYEYDDYSSGTSSSGNYYLQIGNVGSR
ncbi:hypothetical protein GE061_016653 [Apolygus lucorum]|uniref:Uncharacterized protein n=1 Tax=Apolygus lucorum TaxID=248454 RepID=A0A6A4K330_APOLU|nr:hypothetical protein GE061_016653 [Apolygus lucorum]